MDRVMGDAIRVEVAIIYVLVALAAAAVLERVKDAAVVALIVVMDVQVLVLVVVMTHVVLDVLRYRSQSNQLLMEPSRDLLTVPAIHIKELRWEQ